MISAKVIADSISVLDERLTTFVLTYPRFIHSEVLTHRVLSRNASSSRAIPVAKMMAAIRDNPAVPEFWGANQAGMQAAVELSDYYDDETYRDTGSYLSPRERAKERWIRARDEALASVALFEQIGLHKQIANRVLEPWMHITVICTATDWENFYWLRTDKAAQPEFRILAERMLIAHNASEPVTLEIGQWHLPFVKPEEGFNLEDARKASVARTARVSYNNHDGTAPDLAKDVELHDRLAVGGHMSPFEHQATPSVGRYGNFNGWMQYRYLVPNENRIEFPGLIRKKHAK